MSKKSKNSGNPFIDSHTYCYACGLKVSPGTYHQCTKTTPFVTTGSYYCAWCQSYTNVIESGGKRSCGKCGHGLHGGVANQNHTTVHFQAPGFGGFFMWT
jgi:hypothetical protein